MIARQRRIFKNGRSTAGWRRGARVTSLTQLRQGDHIIDVSDQFRAENLAVVTNMAPHPWKHPTNIVYAAWASGLKGERTGEREFAIWDFQLSKSDSVFYLAERDPTRFLRITPIIRPRRVGRVSRQLSLLPALLRASSTRWL